MGSAGQHVHSGLNPGAQKGFGDALARQYGKMPGGRGPGGEKPSPAVTGGGENRRSQMVHGHFETAPGQHVATVAPSGRQGSGVPPVAFMISPVMNEAFAEARKT